jgi:hypothetical protein
MIERLLAGEAALARDELDAADRLFAQVAEADPRNAIAIVGKARVAGRRGDVDLARTLAKQALAIDPKEAAATRLIRELARPAEPAPASPREPVAAPQPRPDPAPSRGRWRGWLGRLLRRR